MTQDSRTDAVRDVQAHLATLFRESRRYGSQLARMVHPDLHQSGFYLIRMLEKCGPSRPSTLAAELEVDRSAMSRLIQSLDNLGLIERTPDPQDKRAYMLDLTPEGRERLARVRDGLENPVIRSLRTWEEEDVRTFARLLQRFVSRDES